MSHILDPRFKTTDKLNVVLVGAGIMSATLAYLIHKTCPNWRINVYERLDHPAGESSDPWNNAGTGHAGYCELNYTPMDEKGEVSIQKAIHISEQFEESKQFWAHLVKAGVVENPTSFLHQVPHLSVVFNQEDKAFLKKRYEKMSAHPLFENMEFIEDEQTLKSEIPLMLRHDYDDPNIAFTRVKTGLDVDFGSLTKQIFDYLETTPNFELFTSCEVRDIDLVEEEDHLWQLKIRNLLNGEKKYIDAQFVFIGAGGGALNLLQKTDIAEGHGYGGFPVSGQWLVCNKEEIVNQHFAKVYGKAEVGAPPMSVPHLDTRIINGKRALLFGPYAGFSTKFLKEGSYWDLFETLELDNIKPMVMAGLKNIPLTKYLINQVRQDHSERMLALKKFVPDAKPTDWEMKEAGQRVQIIRKDKKEGGVLEFGTEVVHSKNGSVAALLGASPGASTAVSVMLEVLEKCYPKEMKSTWAKSISEIIPTYGKELANNEKLLRKTREHVHKVLKMD